MITRLLECTKRVIMPFLAPSVACFVASGVRLHRIAGVFVARVANASCASAVNGWNAHVRISTKPGGCGACTCGHDNTLQRLSIHIGAFNLGPLMRHLCGIGTPGSLQGRAVALLCGLWSLVRLSPDTGERRFGPSGDPRSHSVFYASRVGTVD